MIQTFSNNVTAGANATIPLNNVSLIKGVTATKEGNTISLNKCGVYEVSIDGALTVPTGATVTVQMEKDSVLQSQAQTTVTAVADQVIPFGFATLVQVPFSNTPCPCSAPTLIEFVSSEEATFNHVNVVVTKLV